MFIKWASFAQQCQIKPCLKWNIRCDVLKKNQKCTFLFVILIRSHIKNAVILVSSITEKNSFHVEWKHSDGKTN